MIPPCGNIIKDKNEHLNKRLYKQMADCEKEETLTIVINTQNITDLKTTYAQLRLIYQRVTHLMLELDRPLLDIRILLPNYSKLPGEYLNLSVEELELNHVSTSHLKAFHFKQFKNVAIGGTFDKLHAGHKLMLSVASLLANMTVYCGITDASMIGQKQYLDKMDSWETRASQVRDFLESFCSKGVGLEIIRLNDPFGPTTTDPNIEAIVVSPETYSGAATINDIRQKSGLRPLEIVSIDLIDIGVVDGEEQKLSSTLLRSFVQ